MELKFNIFVKKYLNTSTDYDGVSGVQCVDLAKLYIDKVIGAVPLAIGNAHAYYDDFEDTYLKKYFNRIPYKKGEKPKKGDLVVWGIGYNGTSKYGHIAIATGKNTSSYIYTYDQNYGLKCMHKQKHPYTGISGFLRPKNQKNIVTPPKVDYGTYTLTEKRGVYRGWGSKTEMKAVKDLTANAKAHATSTDPDAPAYLKKGTRVTVKETKTISSGNLWAKIPSGKILIWNADKDKMYIK